MNKKSTLIKLFEIFATGSYDAEKMIHLLAAKDPELFFEIYDELSNVKVYTKVIVLIRSNEKVLAIKEVREIHGCTLREALDAVNYIIVYLVNNGVTLSEPHGALPEMNYTSKEIYYKIVSEIE